MGTNYYVKLNVCPTCTRPEEEIHLGKDSYGWQFSFQYNGGEYYKNVPEMKKWLKNKRIFDEYGKEISYKEFWEIIKAKQQKTNLNHAKKYPSSTDFVIGGYSFSDCEFS